MAAAPATIRRRPPALDVAVVGGGMAGAATALALAQAGFATALLDSRAPRPWQLQDEVDLRVVGLAPSSIALLHELDVWTAIRNSRCSTYTHMHVWDAQSGAELDFDAADSGRDSLGCIVENALVQRALWDALPAAGVRLHCPARVQDMRAHADRIELELADGDAVSARLVVAADGAESPLRKRARISTRGRDYTQRAVVAHVGTERDHQRTASQRFLPGGPLALLPLADGRSSIVWSLPAADAARVLTLDDRAFMHALGVASDYRLGPITSTTARAGFDLRLQLASSYQAERMVLLGDAAHSVHPLAGQGVNLGLRDVVELRATLLAARVAGIDIGAPQTLRRYARRRRSADTLDALGFDALARIYAWQATPLAAARGAGMRLLNHLPAFKRRLARHAAGL
ncbi:MAG: FAD-dependent oxidoreductase [Rhodanobacter sp.]